MLHNKKHLFFDMDDTISASRTPMEDDVHAFYASLSKDIIVVSGAQVSQINIQVRNLPIFRLGQNGNEALSPTGEQIWNGFISDEHALHIHEHIQKLRTLHGAEVVDEEDLVEHRGAQISFSLIGHNETLEKKKQCDPERKVRLMLLEQEPFEHDHLEVRIGGKTNFDYFQKGKHKGYNVSRLIEHMDWNREECVYFGDALFPGGNDETVIGVIDTFPVENHLHTYRILKEHFGL